MLGGIISIYLSAGEDWLRSDLQKWRDVIRAVHTTICNSSARVFSLYSHFGLFGQKLKTCQKVSWWIFEKKEGSMIRTSSTNLGCRRSTPAFLWGETHSSIEGGYRDRLAGNEQGEDQPKPLSATFADQLRNGNRRKECNGKSMDTKEKCKVSDAIDVSCISASTRLSRYVFSKISSSSIVVDLSRFGNEIGRSWMRAWADQVSFGVCQAGLNIASALVCNLRRIGVLDQVQHRSCLFDPLSEKYLSEN